MRDAMHLPGSLGVMVGAGCVHKWKAGCCGLLRRYAPRPFRLLDVDPCVLSSCHGSCSYTIARGASSKRLDFWLCSVKAGGISLMHFREIACGRPHPPATPSAQPQPIRPPIGGRPGGHDHRVHQVVPELLLQPPQVPHVSVVGGLAELDLQREDRRPALDDQVDLAVAAPGAQVRGPRLGALRADARAERYQRLEQLPGKRPVVGRHPGAEILEVTVDDALEVAVELGAQRAGGGEAVDPEKPTLQDSYAAIYETVTHIYTTIGGDMSKPLAGRNAIIYGGAGGIGAGVARAGLPRGPHP